MDPILLTLGAASVFSISAVVAAFFNRALARVCAALSLGAICFDAFLVLQPAGPDRWHFNRLAFAFLRPTPLSGIAFGSLLLSVIAVVAPLQHRNGRPRWGIFFPVCVATVALVSYLVGQHVGGVRGVQNTQSLLAGAQDVRFDRFQLDNHQRRVICTAPEVLRDLETRFRQNVREQRELGLSYNLTVDYRTGGSHSYATFWDAGDVAMYPEGMDGRVPYTISLERPIPALKEMMVFLQSDLAESAGKIMVIEPEGIRYELNKSLIAR